MAQTVQIFVTDDSDVPVEGATVTLHRTETGTSLYQTTDVDGLALFGAVDEERYTLSVTKPDFTSPAPVKIDVAVPPAATAAFFNPPASAAYASIDATRKYIKLNIDEAGAVEIDVAGVDNVVTGPGEIVSAINAALGATIASDVLGEIRLTSTTTGPTSSVRIISDGTVGPSDIEAEDATELVFGLATGFGEIAVVGEASPIDFNDYSVVLTPFGGFVSTKPYACMLWTKIWRHELFNEQTPAPLTERTVWVEVMDRPQTIVPGLDVGDSFYVTSDEHGYWAFELPRGTRARMYIKWLDKYIDFTVPDAASANLDGLLAPYVVSLTITDPEAPVGISVGDTCELVAEALRTDGSVVNNPLGIVFTSSDVSVVSLDGSTLTAVGVGTAEITATFTNAKNQEVVSGPLTVEVSA